MRGSVTGSVRLYWGDPAFPVFGLREWKSWNPSRKLVIGSLSPAFPYGKLFSEKVKNFEESTGVEESVLGLADSWANEGWVPQRNASKKHAK